MTQRFLTYTHLVKLINKYLQFGLLNTSSLTENQFQLSPENKKTLLDKEFVLKVKMFIHGHHGRIHIIYRNKSKCLTIWKTCYDSHIQRKCMTNVWQIVWQIAWQWQMHDKLCNNVSMTNVWIKHMTIMFQARGNK